MACPPTSPERNSKVCWNFSATAFSTFTASGTISRPTPSPASTAIFAFTHHSPSLSWDRTSSIPRLAHPLVATRDRLSRGTRWRWVHYFLTTAFPPEAHRRRNLVPPRQPSRLRSIVPGRRQYSRPLRTPACAISTEHREPMSHAPYYTQARPVVSPDAEAPAEQYDRQPKTPSELPG